MAEEIAQDSRPPEEIGAIFVAQACPLFFKPLAALGSIYVCE